MGENKHTRGPKITTAQIDAFADTLRANVRLLEAAPELAAMVRDLLALHEAHHNHPTHAAARRLLAKAEGK